MARFFVAGFFPSEVEYYPYAQGMSRGSWQMRVMVAAVGVAVAAGGLLAAIF